MAETTNTTIAATAGDLDTSGAANIKPAKSIDTSGAPQQIVPDVDLNHPAVDNDPRAGTTVNQNAIDFNDPTIPGHQAVAEKLGMKVVSDADVAAASIEADKAKS